MSFSDFIKVTRVSDGDVDYIPLSVHLEYPDLFPAFVEPVVEAVIKTKEAVEAVKAIPVKLKKGK